MSVKHAAIIKPHSQIAFVRHGESEWNALGKWTGWVDIPLSQKGRLEAKKAAQTVAHIPFHMAFTSDLSRAHETLAIIKKELHLTSIPTFAEYALKERHYGEYTGKNKWEIQKEIGEEAFKKIRRGWSTSIAQGESLNQVYERVTMHYTLYILPHIISGKNVLFVSHGNTIRAMVKHIENISDEAIEEVELATGEVLIYALDKTGKYVGKEKRAVR